MIDQVLIDMAKGDKRAKRAQQNTKCFTPIFWPFAWVFFSPYSLFMMKLRGWTRVLGGFRCPGHVCCGLLLSASVDALT